jgi:hypothetical protein
VRALVSVVICAACTQHKANHGVDAAGGEQDAAPNSPDAPTGPTITVLRGVDRAGAFTIAEATTLKNSHGVEWTGVYIGGACSAGSGWTKAGLTQMASQLGWVFMPIYVGQQAPSICGRADLSATKGASDGADAAVQMQAFGWAPNRKIPVCLDLEAGSYSYSPSGAQAYAKAWRDAVRSAGYLAYLYSNPTAIDAFYDASVTFDGVWPASWPYTSFANVSPYDLTSLGTRYTHQNRAWQYAGSFAVSGAGNVDGDTSDLLLAPAPGGTNL